MVSMRLQLRPELFILPLFLSMLWLWMSSLQLIYKSVFGVCILLLWANLHGGNAPIGIGIFVFGLLAAPEWSLRQKAPWLLLGVLSWLVSPLGYHQLQIVYEHIVTSNVHLTKNPDHEPFAAVGLATWNGFFREKLWLLYTVFAYVTWVFLVLLTGKRPRRNRKKSKTVALTYDLPQPYRSLIFTLPLGLGLTIMSFHLWRTMIFHVAFLLPIVSVGLANLYILSPRITGAALAALGGFFMAFVIPLQMDTAFQIRGTGWDDKALPMGAAEFVAKEPVPRPIYNTPGYGGYLAWRNPTIPIFMDGRGAPYRQFFGDFAASFKDPNAYQSFFARWNMSTAIENLPIPNIDKNGQFQDLTYRFYPPEQWALVFFDNASQVLVSRAAADPQWLEAREYRFIHLGAPAVFGAKFPGLSDSLRQKMEGELDRCLVEYARNVYCLMGKAGFEDVRGNLDAGLKLLLRAYEIHPRNLNLLSDLAQLSQRLKDGQGVRKYERELKVLQQASAFK